MKTIEGFVPLILNNGVTLTLFSKKKYLFKLFNSEMRDACWSIEKSFTKFRSEKLKIIWISNCLWKQL